MRSESIQQHAPRSNVRSRSNGRFPDPGFGDLLGLYFRRSVSLAYTSLGVGVLVFFCLIESFAQPPTILDKRPIRTPVPVATPIRDLIGPPTGPCSGAASFIVGPRLPRAATTAPTIAWALASSAARNVCRVVIEVQPGTYADPLTITRDTTITNSPPAERPVVTGSITSYGHVFTLTSVNIRDTPAPGAIVLIGGGHSLTDGGLTVLQDVTIERASERGIALKGGVLKVTNCEILSTRAGSSLQGAAIDMSFTGSASRATLDGVRIRDNEGWGIVAAGSRNVLLARNVTVSGARKVSLGGVRSSSRAIADRNMNGRVVPAVPGRVAGTTIPRPAQVSGAGEVGAIRISSGAALYAKNLDIDHNDWMGLLVDQGGIANIQDSTFNGTLTIGDDPLNSGGNNITVREGSTVELLNFRSNNSGRAGLEVNGGWIRGTNGILTGNEFGVDISSHVNGWRRFDCFLNVRAYDNRSADLSGEIEVPSSTDNNNQRQPCRGVPVPSIYSQ